MSSLFEGLPRASNDDAVLYVLGPGFGESQVVQFPDGATVVVDCCRQDGVCLTAELLAWLGVDQIDLLVITHPDLDHIDGLDELLVRHLPRRAWRYPGYADLGEWVARWLEHKRGDHRLERLRRAIQAFENATAEIEASLVSYGFREWPSPHARGRVACLAPPSADLRRAAQPLSRLIKFGAGNIPTLDQDVLDYLLGDASGLDRHGNRLSLALALRWGEHRVLLAGDVENGNRPRTGWNGILAALKEDGRENELTDLSVAKAAHHGSKQAWHDDLWRLAALGRKVPVLVTTRFDRGANPPPHPEVFRSARQHVDVLSLTSDSSRTTTQRTTESWVQDAGTRVPGTVGCVAIQLPSQGAPSVWLAGEAGAWRLDETKTGALMVAAAPGTA